MWAGFAAAYINGYITGPVVTTYIGKGYGGILAAITAAVAGLLSLPNTLGWVPASAKKYYMVGGPLCFALVGLLPLVVGYGTIGHWGSGWGLIIFFVLQGVSACIALGVVWCGVSDHGGGSWGVACGSPRIRRSS